jgi:ATP-binding cassette subfamily C (CFTR/MRP) protein 1
MENGKIFKTGSYDIIKNEYFHTMLEEKQSEKNLDDEIGKEICDNLADLKRELNEEKHLNESVQLGDYIKFFSNGSGFAVVTTLIIMLVSGETLFVLTDVLLSIWTENTSLQNYIFYISSTSCAFLISTTGCVMFFYLCKNSSRVLFAEMLQSVIKSPITFFQTIPLGRILKYFQI